MATLLSGGGASSLTDWQPGPIALGDEQPVVVGTYVLPFGPRKVQILQQPNIAEQVTTSAVFLWSYGWLPTQYVLEGYPNGGDRAVLDAMLAQFTGQDLAVVKLLIPCLGVADYVRLVDWQPDMDAQTTWRDPHYQLRLAAAGPSLQAGTSIWIS